MHKKGLVPTPLPSWLQPLLARLAAETGIWGEGGQLPNHVLINAYQPGEGIMPHEDGPLYRPAVAILSLEHPAVVRFARKRGEADAADAGTAEAQAAPASGEVVHCCTAAAEPSPAQPCLPSPASLAQPTRASAALLCSSWLARRGVGAGGSLATRGSQ